MSGKLPINISSPRLQRIHHDLLDEHGVTISVLRLDQIHPLINGNKWFKLKRNLEFIQQQGIETVLSFGGAWSNHLMALAAAGRLLDFQTIGMVRGEIVEPLNPVLRFVRAQGMELLPVSREQYRQKQSASFMLELKQRFGDFYCLPEGGSNRLGVEGCTEIAEYLNWSGEGGKQLVAMACGTGASLAGLIAGLSSSGQKQAQVLGMSVLKAPGYLAKEVNNWLLQLNLHQTANWQVVDDFHCGGYAKVPPELAEFVDCFQTEIAVPIEPVYTGKLAFGLWRMLVDRRIERGSEVIAIHTGGISGKLE